MKGNDMRIETGRGLTYIYIYAERLDPLTSLLEPFLEIRGVDRAGKRTGASLNVSTNTL